MAIARVFSRARLGISAPLVEVEVHLSGGLPAFNIVGLPEAAVKEARDRVRSAIITSQFEFPARRITVNLAPADLPKDFKNNAIWDYTVIRKTTTTISETDVAKRDRRKAQILFDARHLARNLDRQGSSSH